MCSQDLPGWRVHCFSGSSLTGHGLVPRCPGPRRQWSCLPGPFLGRCAVFPFSVKGASPVFLKTAASGVRCFFVIYLDDSLLSEPPGKESACSVGDLGSISGLGRSPGGGHGNPLQYSCLENPMDRGYWGPTAHGVAESRTGLSE